VSSAVLEKNTSDLSLSLACTHVLQALVAQRADNFVHWISRHPDSKGGKMSTEPFDLWKEQE